jgi:hypothetical protein
MTPLTMSWDVTATAVLKLLSLRDELLSRNLGYLLKTWTCPTANPVDCDPCGKNSGADDSWGYLNGGGGWEHIACRCVHSAPPRALRRALTSSRPACALKGRMT